jgi:hypothetical protein
MSILDALKTFKQERESIDDVAALPQTLIMQMAQKGQIPKTDLPMILSRKAEIAQTQAQMNALRQQQAQGAQPTIIEKMIAANAQQEAPQEMTDVGIASNPVPEMRMAGGGIVAFAQGDLVEGMTEEEYLKVTNPEEYARQKRQSSAWAGLANSKTPYLAEDFRRDVRGFVDPIKGFFTAPFDKAKAEQAKKAEIAKLMRDKNLSATDAAAFQSAKNIQTADSPLDYDMYNPKKVVRPTERTDTAPVTRTEGKNAPVAQAQTAAPKQKLLGDYEKLLMDEREAAKGAREEAKYMRLMEAGLNIMGGTSPYAFANIGKGAAEAAKGYGEDIKGLRSEERERVKQLASIGAKREELGLKERELGVMEKYRKDLTDLERQKIGVLTQRNIDDKMAAGVNNIFSQLMKKYDAMLADGSTTEADLYRQAQEMYTSTTGKGMKGTTGVPTAKVPLYDPSNRTFK